MKKKTVKKVKHQKKEVQKKVSPIDELRASIEDLKTRNMRITQEFDRLSTRVATQGDTLFKIHQNLQIKKLMPYDPASCFPEEMKKATLPVADPGKNKPTFIGSNRSEIKYFTVSAKIGQTFMGHLSKNATWTFDPAEIAMFETRESITGLLEKAKLPEGAKTKIEEHR